MRAASPTSSRSSASWSAAASIISRYRCSGWPTTPMRTRVWANPWMVARGVRRSCAASDTSCGKDESVGPTERADTNLSSMTESRQLLDDMQASVPDVRLGLSRAGVQGVSKAIRLRWGGAEKLVSAEIDSTVDLDPAQKGVHMSRFPELFEEAIDEVVIGEAFLVEELAEHIARHIVERQAAGRAEVRIAARYPLERRTPVTGLATQEMISIIGIAAASPGSVRRIVGVEAKGINACPCAQGLVRGKATERLLEAGFEAPDVERILQLVPIATHNQRGRGTLYVGSKEPVNAEQLVEIVEASMSSPVYELLKRPDELFVVEHAHLQ